MTKLDLSALSNRFDLTFEQSPMGLFLYDTSFQVREFNQALLDLLQSRREGFALNLQNLRDRRIIPALEKALEGEAAVYVGPYQSTAGTAYRMIHFRCHPLRSDDGVLLGGIGIMEDASEHLRIEQELREQLETVERQAATIRSLSTPILQVWDHVLCLPVIGQLDTRRAAEMTETMLEAVIAQRCQLAIVDLTGVDVVDTGTADHILQLLRAASLVGAETVLCGIRPAVAQTMTNLGVNMAQIRTTRTMNEALRAWIKRPS